MTRASTMTSRCLTALACGKSAWFGRIKQTVLALKFWARVFSLLALILFSSVAFGQTFGRFGYAPVTRVPGWKITAHGFQANASVSDEFVFPSPLADWKPTSTTAGSQTVSVA